MFSARRRERAVARESQGSRRGMGKISLLKQLKSVFNFAIMRLDRCFYYCSVTVIKDGVPNVQVKHCSVTVIKDGVPNVQVKHKYWSIT